MAGCDCVPTWKEYLDGDTVPWSLRLDLVFMSSARSIRTGIFSLAHFRYYHKSSYQRHLKKQTGAVEMSPWVKALAEQV